MKAIILAAGRGERMKPLTDHCPKPMLEVANRPLIEHHVIKLVNAGVTEIVINIAWLGQQICQYLGDGHKWGVSIRYSDEGDHALETAGGIKKALSLFEHTAKDDVILVVNADVYTSFSFNDLPSLPKDMSALLWMTDNPEHNVKGDFSLVGGKLNLPVCSNTSQNYTYTGIGLYRVSFFEQVVLGSKCALGPMLREQVQLDKVAGLHIQSHWTDVGTPQRLAQLNDRISSVN